MFAWLRSWFNHSVYWTTCHHHSEISQQLLQAVPRINVNYEGKYPVATLRRATGTVSMDVYFRKSCMYACLTHVRVETTNDFYKRDLKICVNKNAVGPGKIKVSGNNAERVKEMWWGESMKLICICAKCCLFALGAKCHSALLMLGVLFSVARKSGQFDWSKSYFRPKEIHINLRKCTFGIRKLSLKRWGLWFCSVTIAPHGCASGVKSGD